MNVSRQKLYAAGEPLGNDATRREPGRIIYGGGGGSSSSSSASTTNTTDKRMVVDQGVGVSSDSSTVNVTAIDGGAINAALNFATTANGVNAKSYSDLLTTADKVIFSAGDNFASLLDAQNKQVFSAGDNYTSLLTATGTANDKVSQAFGSLVGLADKLFNTGADLLESTASTTLAQVSALNTAQNDAAGSIDQKTIIVLAVAGAVAAYGIFGKK